MKGVARLEGMIGPIATTMTCSQVPAAHTRTSGTLRTAVSHGPARALTTPYDEGPKGHTRQAA